MHLVDLRRVARERGRGRMVLARMWHVMVPKVPLGYWLMVGYHMSGSLSILLHVCHPSLPLVSLRRVAREHKRVGSQTQEKNR